MIFISYAHEDYKEAAKIYDTFQRKGLNVWLDKKSLRPGERWKVAIENAINESRYFVALLSSTSVSKKGYVQKELRLAMEVLDKIPDDDIFIIPLRLDKCETTFNKLKELNRIDLFEDWEQGINKILKFISISEKISEDDDSSQVVNKGVPNLLSTFNHFLKNLNSYKKEYEKNKINIDLSRSIRTSEHIPTDLVAQSLKNFINYCREINPDYIIGINRGGSMVAATASLQLGLPSKNFVRCRFDINGIEVSENNLSGVVLIIYDKIRVGTHISSLVNESILRDNINIKHIKTACLYAYSKSNKIDEIIGLDFFSYYIEAKDNIFLPWDANNLHESNIGLSELSLSHEQSSRK